MSEHCSRCDAALVPGNQFCEECGLALSVPAGDESTATACPKCAAGPDEMDSEGFCSSCGIRREERGRDHWVLTVSPQLGGVSDRGLKHHRNEDYLALRSVEDRQASVLVVCDGVSSVRDADAASETAAECACRAFEEVLRDGGTIGEPEMEAALASAQISVAALPFSQGSDEEPPATTIVAAAVQSGRVVVGWLGDSRAYWIDGEGVQPLTDDHSWLHEVTASGEMSGEEAGRSAQAHAITRWLGADAAPDFKPSIRNFQIPGSGKLLLCTDGLWNYAPEPETLAGLLRAVDGDATEVASALVDFARSKGGNDNITASVLSIDKESVPPSDEPDVPVQS